MFSSDYTRPLPAVPRGYRNWREVYREALPHIKAHAKTRSEPYGFVNLDQTNRSTPADVAGLDVSQVAHYAAREQAEEDLTIGVLGINELYALYIAVANSPGTFENMAERKRLHGIVMPLFDARRAEEMNKNR
jgi:hypothetical protein